MPTASRIAIAACVLIASLGSADALAAIVACNGTNTYPPCLNPTASDPSANTSGGAGALGALNGGTNNTAFGSNAGAAMTFEIYNTAVGSEAMRFATGSGVTGIGAFALENNSATSSTAVGYAALMKNTSGVGNTAVGEAALSENQTGNQSTAVGHAALQFNTANSNTAVGATAMQFTATGANNTAVGTATLYSNVDGSNNTASGFNALVYNTASGNSGFGASALGNNTTGSNNNAQGFNALLTNSSGSNNVAVGNAALKSHQTGNSNVALGNQALLADMFGVGNIAIGGGAGKNLSDGSNNIYVGNAGLSSESGTMRIGAGVHTKTFIAGIVDGPVSNPATVTVNTATGELGIASSSARYKKNIRELDDADVKLAQLRPVSFSYKSDATDTKQYGLVAEDVARVYPELVAHNAKGEIETVEYQALIPLLLKQNQQQQARIDAMQLQIDELMRTRATR